MRTRKRRRTRYFPMVETTPLDLTPEELLADLDPGWAVWNPPGRNPDRSVKGKPAENV